MKKVMLFFVITTMFSCAYSQNEISTSVDLSPLTIEMIKKYYTPEEIKEISKDDNKLNILNYDYSKSFNVISGQNYTQDQLLNLDVLKYLINRKKSESVVIYDEVTGLNIQLFSIEKMKEDKVELGYYKNNSSSINSKNMKR